MAAYTSSSSKRLTRDTLWPPDHKLADIAATISVTDNCDPKPVVCLVSITSNKADNGPGDGDTPNDIQGAAFGTDDRQFRLRAERSGGRTGRVYTVIYEAADASGNKTTQQATVAVPQSKQ
jgi:endo-1,4-beta-xylanase